jgi:hypothetical protein
MTDIPSGFKDLLDAHIDAPAKKYLGKDRYPYRKPDEVRVIFTITPDRAQALG